MKFILFLVLSVCAHAQFFGGNAAKIRGKNVKGVLSCSNGDALSWVSANNQFECAAPGAVGSSVGVKKAGTLIGTRAAINLIEGTAMTLTVTDDPGNNEVDVTITPSYTAGGSGAISISSGVIDIDTAAVCLKSTTCAPTGSFDLSGSAATKSMKAGTSLPGTCAVGELFYKTDATAGQNVYGCTATNTWTVQGGGGGSTTQADALMLGPLHQPLIINGATFAFTSNRVYCGSFFADRNYTVGHMSMWQTTGIGSGDMRFAIYNSSGSLLSTSAAPSSSGNILNATISQSLTAGNAYALCVATNDSTVRAVRMFLGQGEEAIYNANESNLYYCANTMSGTTMPSTCGSKTNITSGGFPWFAISK